MNCESTVLKLVPVCQNFDPPNVKSTRCQRTFATDPPFVAMPIQPCLSAIFTEAGLLTTVQEWCDTQGIHTAKQFGMMAPNEEKVDTNIINVIHADIALDTIKKKVDIRMCWSLCREAMERETKLKMDGDVNDSPLPDPTANQIKTKWMAKHGFYLQASELLNDSLQATLWKDMAQAPRRLKPLLLDKLVLLSAVNRSNSHQVLVKSGESMKLMQVDTADLTSHHEIVVRAKALFYTISYVTVEAPDFLSFQDARLVANKIDHFVHQTFHGRFGERDHYVSAWAQTITYFAEQVTQHGMSLGDVIRSAASWEHYWSPGASASPNSYETPERRGRPQSSPKADLDPTIQKQLNEANQRARQMQSERDRAQHQLSNNPKGKGKGYGNQKGYGNHNNGGSQNQVAEQVAAEIAEPWHLNFVLKAKEFVLQRRPSDRMYDLGSFCQDFHQERPRTLKGIASAVSEHGAPCGVTIVPSEWGDAIRVEQDATQTEPLPPPAQSSLSADDAWTRDFARNAADFVQKSGNTYYDIGSFCQDFDGSARPKKLQGIRQAVQAFGREFGLSIGEVKGYECLKLAQASISNPTMWWMMITPTRAKCTMCAKELDQWHLDSNEHKKRMHWIENPQEPPSKRLMMRLL
jgi:hypothetical protein